MIRLELFIHKYVVKCEISMFLDDILNNKRNLCKKIQGKNILVIGGAGSIGSSFIKAVLPFQPSSLTVVDINENDLVEWRI